MHKDKDTDSWSLGEIQALVVKAARGSGRHWGWSEEAAFAVDWLEQRGLPGTLAISALLSADNVNDCPVETGMHLSDGALQLKASEPMQLHITQPLLLLPFLSWLLMDASEKPANHQTPATDSLWHVDLAFNSIVLRMESTANETVTITLPDLSETNETKETNEIKMIEPEYRFHDTLIYGGSDCSVQLSALTDSAVNTENLTDRQYSFHANLDNRVSEKARSAIENLDQLAKLTYAPVTEESRHKGAGAGLTDND